MSLANLIRKRETGKPANANPAKAANDGQAKEGTLARLATLALANPTEAKTAKPAIVGACGTAATSWGWRVTYPEDHPGDRFSGRVFECYIVPVQTLAEVQAIHPGAKIEPITEAAQ